MVVFCQFYSYVFGHKHIHKSFSVVPFELNYEVDFSFYVAFHFVVELEVTHQLVSVLFSNVLVSNL